MKIRYVLFPLIALLSLVFVGGALASLDHQGATVQSGNPEAAVDVKSTNIPQPGNVSMLPGGLAQAQATLLPNGVPLRSPESPAVLGDWDNFSINFPRVLNDGSQYILWYNGRPGQFSPWATGVAASPDGDDWTKDASNPVLGTGAPGDWDEAHRGQAAFLLEGSEYKMWYSGGPNAGSWHTGYATSTNGIDWNIYSGNPVLLAGDPGAWDEAEADAPAIINDGGTYKMWYHGCNSDYSVCSIGYAESPDGIDWTKHGSPVLTGFSSCG